MSQLEKYVIPQALEIEAAILGAMMNDSSGLDEVFSLLRSEMFYKTENEVIFKAASSLYSSNKKIDLLTVSNKLDELGLTDKSGGVGYIIELTQKAASSAHIQEWSLIVLDMYLRRELSIYANQLAKKAFNRELSVQDVLDEAGADIDKIGGVLSKENASQSFYDAMVSIPERVEFLTNNQGEVTGLPTGLKKLDNHFNGWQPTDFIVIGGDSGMGKTAFIMTSMLAAAKSGKAVGMFSMEMSVIQLATRAVAVESNFHMNQLARKGFEKVEYFQGLYEVVDELKDLPIYIDDKPALTVPEMKRKARALKRKYDIQLLVIDFLQMFSGDKETRINVGEAARESKNIAKELNIPVIGLSQLSREVRRSKNCIPQKNHLKEASTIEEAADVIGLLYRPDYYGYTYENNPDLYNEDLGLIGEENAALIVAKNRNGALGTVGLNYVADKTKYVNGVESNNPF